MRALLIVISLQLALGTVPAAGQTTGDNLPDIGTPASTTLSLVDEYKIGLMIVRSLRDAGQIIEDPEITEYLQSLGMRLSSQAHEGAHRFFEPDRDRRLQRHRPPGSGARQAPSRGTWTRHAARTDRRLLCPPEAVTGKGSIRAPAGLRGRVDRRPRHAPWSGHQPGRRRG